MAPHHSTYYPPRRGRWQLFRNNPLRHLRKKLRFDQFSEIDMPLRHLLVAFVVPCYALHWTPFAKMTKWWCAAYVACLANALVFLGHSLSGIASGLMIGVHASGFIALSPRLGVRRNLLMVVAFTLSVIGALSLLVYGPVSSFLSQNMIMALNTPSGSVVVNRMAKANRVQRGDWIVYNIHGDHFLGRERGVYVRDGYGLERVWAKAGDRISFRADTLQINGIDFPRVANMPFFGEKVVPDKHWFIWPSMSQRGGHQAAATITSALMELAMVKQEDYVGRPFKYWFTRQQNLP